VSSKGKHPASPVHSPVKRARGRGSFGVFGGRSFNGASTSSGVARYNPSRAAAPTSAAFHTPADTPHAATLDILDLIAGKSDFCVIYEEDCELLLQTESKATASDYSSRNSLTSQSSALLRNLQDQSLTTILINAGVWQRQLAIAPTSILSLGTPMGCDVCQSKLKKAFLVSYGRNGYVLIKSTYRGPCEGKREEKYRTIGTIVFCSLACVVRFYVHFPRNKDEVTNVITHTTPMTAPGVKAAAYINRMFAAPSFSDGCQALLALVPMAGAQDQHYAPLLAGAGCGSSASSAVLVPTPALSYEEAELIREWVHRGIDVGGIPGVALATVRVRCKTDTLHLFPRQL
jgi:hypothetical protein